MEKIILNKADYLAKGSHRAIYLHPFDQKKCIKIVMKECQQKMREKNTHWYKKIRPLAWFDENKKEIKAYTILNKKNEEIFNYIPKFYGVIHTNLGDGMLIDYVDNSITLLQYIKNYGFSYQLQEALLQTLKVLYQNNIQIRDQHPDNYIIQFLKDNQIKIELIDGIGNSQLIPLANYITFIGQKQIKRRFNKLCDNIIKKCPEYKENIDNFSLLLHNI